MRPTILILASLVLALAGASASAQWKWRDASGRVTVSDLPPPSTVREQDVLSRPADSHRATSAAKPAAGASAPIGSAAPAVKSSTDPELEARRKRAADEQIAQQRQADERNAAVRAENCGRARSYLGTLSEGKRVARTNAQGELEPIDDKARAEETQRARETIAANCK
jgi:cytoskeletal protein RodZ